MDTSPERQRRAAQCLLLFNSQIAGGNWLMRFMTKSNPQSAIRDPQSQDGVLVIDKPEGLTSHDVVARVRKLLGTRRVGHAGTLDPFATGVLVVCVNRATRLVQFLTGD